MQSSELSQQRAKEGTVEVPNDHQLISIVQNDHESVELLQSRRAEEVIVDIQDGHQSISVPDDPDLPWIKEVTKNYLDKCCKITRSPWPWAISLVPEDIRQCDMKAYDPLVVTIGPYHYNKFKERIALQAMQDHKWHCVWRLLSRRTKCRANKATHLLSTCLKRLKLKDDFVRECYSEDLQRLKDDDLALIMLLDGCFIIHVLLNFNGNLRPGDTSNWVTYNDNKDGQEKEDIAAGLKEGMRELNLQPKEVNIDLRVDPKSKVWDTMLLDLVKVENQMPFHIIEILFDELKTPGDEDIDLVNIAHKLLSPLHPSYPSFTKVCFLTKNKVRHLLDLFHSTLVPSDDYLEKKKINLTKDITNFENSEIIWVPSATELQLTGVKFAEKKGRDISFLDISFTNGTIEIPKVRLHGATSTLFKNLIAFEQCDYLGIEDSYVTAYAFFMDYMINSSKDVELFELEGIFHNQLGTPDHAATLINQLCPPNSGSGRQLSSMFNERSKNLLRFQVE